MSRKGYNAIVVYLDDFLIIGESREACQAAFDALLALLQNLGFSISWHKVVPPTQRLVFLGIFLDTVECSMALPADKLNALHRYVRIIGLLHKEFNLQNPLTDNWMVESLFRGIRRVKGASVNQKLPITIDILFRIWKTLNFRSSLDSSFWAICLTAFFGMFRKSHLLTCNMSSFPQTSNSQNQIFFFILGE